MHHSWLPGAMVDMAGFLRYRTLVQYFMLLLCIESDFLYLIFLLVQFSFYFPSPGFFTFPATWAMHLTPLFLTCCYCGDIPGNVEKRRHDEGNDQALHSPAEREYEASF